MVDWHRKTIGDLVTLQRGIDLPDAERKPGSVPIVGSAGVTGFHNVPACKGPCVTVGRSGASAGVVFYICEDFWPLNTCLYVKDFNGNDPRFSFYFLKTFDLAGLNSGSAQPSLNRNFVHPVPATFPDPPEQRAIASVLGALDDKIALNRRMNETLEAMARAIFKDWFVDFGPTRAKQEGRAPYLAPDIWSLFPDRLDDEGKPEGWNIAPLGTCFDVNPSEAIRPGSEAPYLDMAALPTTGPNADEPVDREFRSGSKFRNGDTLVARITPCLENGKTAYIQHLPADSVGWGSTEFIVLRSRPPIPIFVPYLVARLEDFREHAIRSMTGTSGRQRVNASDIQRYFLFSPNKSELWQVFARIGTPMFERIAATQAESRTLAATRDLLLPKLMSGEVRIREAEKAVEDAL